MIYERHFVLSLQYWKALLARFIILRATPPVLNTRPHKWKLDWRKVKTCWFDLYQNGFYLSQKNCTVDCGWKKAQQILTPARKECNKLDLTAASCFWLANHNNCLGALLLVVSHLFANPVLVLWVGSEKKQMKQNLDVRNILAGSNTELEML